MNQRSTQLLLAAVCLLLIANLLQSRPHVSTARADEATGAPPILRAHAFELLDKQGKAVAQLFVGDDGGGNIRLRSGDGLVRVKVGATADGSGLILFDNQAEPAVHLAANKSGTSATLAEKGKTSKVIHP